MRSNRTHKWKGPGTFSALLSGTYTPSLASQWPFSLAGIPPVTELMAPHSGLATFSCPNTCYWILRALKTSCDLEASPYSHDKTCRVHDNIYIGSQNVTGHREPTHNLTHAPFHRCASWGLEKEGRLLSRGHQVSDSESNFFYYIIKIN